MNKEVEHVIIMLENKILKLEAKMSKIAYDMRSEKEIYNFTYSNKDGDIIAGYIRTINKLKECIETLNVLDEY